MSSGSFQIVGYEDASGDIRPIRGQPETVTDWNPAAVGSISGAFVRISGGRRSYGTKAKSVSLKRPLGAVVEGIQPYKTITLPVFSNATFATLSASIGSTVEYLGVDWEVAGTSSEAGR